VLSAFGPPGNLAVAEVPDPLPGPGQALVDVHIANITFVETQVRAGRPPNPAMLPDLPGVLGNGVGGIVAAVGEGGVPGSVWQAREQQGRDDRRPAPATGSLVRHGRLPGHRDPAR
jgi:NADPH:quinone reductase-like Zn-dependent oxidoreductase